MRRPVCIKCQIEMRPHKTGAFLESMAAAEPYQIWSADVFRCEGCAAEVATGFANKPLAENHNKPRYAIFSADVFTRFWNGLKDKAAA